MQSAAGKRALSTLASKLHPQLPLSPRESQQLLTLLTTSFRAHLDREHPVPEPRRARKSSTSNVHRSPSPARAPSSYASASRHIDSILTNPLFAVKPHRRASEPAAVDVLRDPVSWFMSEIAAGSGTLAKAAMCLDLQATTAETSSPRHNARSPAVIIAEWLRTSGTDISRDFIDFHTSKHGRGSKFMDTLVSMLFAEGHGAVPWRWFIRSQDQRVKETNLDLQKVLEFKKQLLLKMVTTQANTSLDEGLAVFMQAFRMTEIAGHESAYNVLRPAGAHLVDRIISTPDHSISPEIYQSFLLSSRRWLGNWSQAVEAMLWLHHPGDRNALHGSQYIQDPAGALLHVQGSRGRRNFLVQLCLATARQLLEEKKYAEAQTVMGFTKAHFADLVLSKPLSSDPKVITQRKERMEKKNLELLDSLAPA